MILDTLAQAQRYLPLNPLFKQAFAFLLREDLATLAPGEYPIDGDRVFARIVNEAGSQNRNGPLELHRKYIDIQYVLAGTDSMAWCPRARCTQAATPYNRQTDAEYFSDNAESWFDVEAGSYALFFPEDAHKAMISEGIIHKVIIKVAI